MASSADTRTENLTAAHEELVTAGLTAVAVREQRKRWTGDSLLAGEDLIRRTRERIAEGAAALELRMTGTGFVAVEVEGPDKHGRGGELTDMLSLAADTDLDGEVVRRASEAIERARAGWSHDTPSRGWRAYVRCASVEAMQVFRPISDGDPAVVAEILTGRAICAGESVVDGQVTGTWSNQVGGPATAAAWSPAEAGAVSQVMAAISVRPQPTPSPSAGIFDSSKRAQAVDARLVERPEVWRAALTEAGWKPADGRGGWTRPGTRSGHRHAFETQSGLIVYTTSDSKLAGAPDGVRYRPLELMWLLGGHPSVDAAMDALGADGSVPPPPVRRASAGRVIARYPTTNHASGFSAQPDPVTSAEIGAIAQDLIDRAQIALSGSVVERQATGQLEARLDATVEQQLGDLLDGYDRWVSAICAAPREVMLGEEGKDGESVYGLWPTSSVVFAQEGVPLWELRCTLSSAKGAPRGATEGPKWAVYPVSAAATQGIAGESGTYAVDEMAYQYATPEGDVQRVWRVTTRVALRPVRVEQIHRITDASGVEVATAEVTVGRETVEVPAAVLGNPIRYLSDVGGKALWCDVRQTEAAAAVAGASLDMTEIRSARAAGWRGPTGAKRMTTQGTTVDGVTTDFRSGEGPVERLAEIQFAEPLPRAAVPEAARQVRDAWRGLGQPHATAALMAGASATLMIGVSSIIYLWGCTGSRKTSIVNAVRSATALRATYASRDITADSSPAGIRAALGGGHHQMALLDDWASGAIRDDGAGFLGELARQMVGGTGPAKATQGGRARSDVPLPDAVLFATGEQPMVGGSASAEGRLVQVEVGKIPLDAMDGAWSTVGGWGGTWSRLYATFVAWLEANDIEAISAEVRRRTPAGEVAADPRIHPQTAAAHAALDAALEVWGDFLADVGCDEELVSWSDELRSDLVAAVLERAEYAAFTTPADQFVEALRRAFLTGTAHLTAYETLDSEEVSHAVWARLGWRIAPSKEPRGTGVGWIRDGLVYLTADAFAAANAQAQRDKTQQPGTAITVRKALDEAGQLQRKDGGKKKRLTYTAAAPHTKKVPTTVISLDLILGGPVEIKAIEWEEM